QLAPDLIDGKACRLLAVERRHHVRVFARRDVRTLLQRLWYAGLARLDQVARRMANHTLEGGPTGLQIGAREVESSHRRGAAGLCLGYVGARYLADVKAVLRRPQIPRQNGNIVFAQADNGRVL